MRRSIAVMFAATLGLGGAMIVSAPASASMARIAPTIGEAVETAHSAVEEVRSRRGRYSKRRSFRRGRHLHAGRYYYPRRVYRSSRYYYPHRRYYRRDSGSAAAAGIIGFAAGAILGGALANPGYGGHNWHAYCGSKYRSYDPRTGTFLGYDGRRHYCR